VNARKPKAAAKAPAILVDNDRPAKDVGSKIRKRAAAATVGKTELVHTPKVFPRIALFKATDARTKREVHATFVEVVSSRDVEIHFKGPELRIFDFLVWAQVAKLVRDSATLMRDGTKIYGAVTATMRSLCLLVGLPVNEESYERILESLEALWDADFKLVQYEWSLPRPQQSIERHRMLTGMRVRNEKKSASAQWDAQDIRLQLDAGVFNLFLPGQYCTLDAKALKALIKSPLSAWLYAHLSTHDNFSKGMRYDTLQGLAGLEHVALKEVRRMTRAAIAALEKQGHVTDVDVAGTEVFKLRPLTKAKLSPAKKMAGTPTSVPVKTSFVRKNPRLVPHEGTAEGDIERHDLCQPRQAELPQIAFESLLNAEGVFEPHLLEVYGDSDVASIWCSRAVHRGHPQFPAAYKAIRARLKGVAGLLG
jgi:hypothetical protein